MPRPSSSVPGAGPLSGSRPAEAVARLRRTRRAVRPWSSGPAEVVGEVGLDLIEAHALLAHV
ncbi:hypothetical protein KCW65_26385, partial [Mycobacterium tuberculosis]|nr:hypothetical protein [Mycobacterium tuberculosis]